MINQFIFLVVLFVSFEAKSFRISPMVLKFQGEKGQSILLENPKAERIPVQIEVFKRVHKNGKEERIPTADFSIYPEQLTLGPLEKRRVRVSWVGDIQNTEKSYRLVVSQLPIKFNEPKVSDKSTSQINILLQYVASIYVIPVAAKSSIKPLKAEVEKKGVLLLTLVNEGNAHQVIKGGQIKLSQSTREFSRKIDVSSTLEKVNLLAGEERKFEINIPDLDVGAYSVELEGLEKLKE